MTDVLKTINEVLTTNGINYEFGVWNSAVPNVYFVGEYQENPSTTEDGLVECDFILNGFNDGTWAGLENARIKIEKLFSNFTKIADSGNGLAISYEGALIIPTGEMNAKRIQINLHIKEWRVNIYG